MLSFYMGMYIYVGTCVITLTVCDWSQGKDLCISTRDSFSGMSI